MPLYSNKMPIQSLGGNCILWRGRFESADDELRCTIPPADVEVTEWSPGPTRYAGEWNFVIEAPGELDLVSYDISHNEQPTLAESRVYVSMVDWEGNQVPVLLGPGDVVMLSLWFENTSIGRTYARGES